MEYPEYRAKGWQIGSGPVESACKTVVGQRLKLAGMRWGEDGTDALCHLRALFQSEHGPWDAFWRRQATAPQCSLDVPTNDPSPVVNACSTNKQDAHPRSPP